MEIITRLLAPCWVYREHQMKQQAWKCSTQMLQGPRDHLAQFTLIPGEETSSEWLQLARVQGRSVSSPPHCAVAAMIQRPCNILSLKKEKKKRDQLLPN